ncbi:MAG TPA: hypothetical protein PKD09_02480 [Aggregatilinea sp.]|uniref:hypothetical protein n=1 Tax=Aggregatilinea sp. TaxID=2806333 RepID=UPI002D11286F|nr:hypothetical protein [Aggregatilinea sp.]HML20485.1 hypothetical protein [Aggregatilinea sp.]
MGSQLLKRHFDRHAGDMLLAYADALVAGLAWSLPFKHNSTPDQSEDLFALTEQLYHTLVPVEPSPIFVRELRSHLMDVQLVDEPSLWERTRQLPLPVQIAAGLGGATLTAGIVLVARRPLLDALGELRGHRTSIA